MTGELSRTERRAVLDACDKLGIQGHKVTGVQDAWQIMRICLDYALRMAAQTRGHQRDRWMRVAADTKMRLKGPN